MEKTANAVVFPRLEPYLTVSRIYDAAEKMAAAEVAQRSFDKEGEGFISSLAANSLANLADEPLSALGLGSTRVKKKYESIEDNLSPEHFNRMKSHDVKRTFTLLALYDDELKQYKFPELIRAYNDSVQLNPYSYKNPTVLRNLMVKNLQSAGVKDTFEIKAELDIAKLMGQQDAEYRMEQRNLVMDKERKKLLESEEDKAIVAAPQIKGRDWERIKRIIDVGREAKGQGAKASTVIKSYTLEGKTDSLVEKILAANTGKDMHGMGILDIRAAAKDYLIQGEGGLMESLTPPANAPSGWRAPKRSLATNQLLHQFHYRGTTPTGYN